MRRACRCFGGWGGPGIWAVVILGGVWVGGAKETREVDMEVRELKGAVVDLQRENSELRKQILARQKELGAATNRLARLEGRADRVADDEDARVAAEWRAMLRGALKNLAESEQEIHGLQKRLRLLAFASREALKTAEKVEPSRRALVEGELRESDKVLAGNGEGRTPPITRVAEAVMPTSVRVAGVRLDLGVAALGVGRKRGARVGMPFVVMRGKSVLAVLTLAEVRDSASLAIIDQMDAEKPIAEGDTAILRKM